MSLMQVIVKKMDGYARRHLKKTLLLKNKHS
jgi:hypothetical protein